MPNIVKVEIVVENATATEAFRQVQRESEQTGITIDRSFTRGTQAVQAATTAVKTHAQAIRESELAAKAAGVTALLANTKTAEAARSVATAYKATDREVEQLRASLVKTRDEALKLQVALARKGASDPARAAADVALKAGRGLESLEFDPSSFSRVDVSSRSAKGALAFIREENKNLQKEVVQSGGLLKALVTNIQGVGTPLASIVSGIIGANLITGAVQGVIQIGTNYVEAYRAAQDARAGLLRSSVDVGANIRSELNQVASLREEYKSLSEAIIASTQAAAQAVRRVPVTAETVGEAGKNVDNEATRALRNLPGEALSRAAFIAGRERGIAAKEIEKTLREFAAGNTAPLIGIGDAEAQAKFAGVIGKLPKDFTELEKRLARTNALLLEASPLYTNAATAAEKFRVATEPPKLSEFALAFATTPLGLDLKNAKQFVTGNRPPVDAYVQARSDAKTLAEENTKEELARLLIIKKGEEDIAKFREGYHQRRDAADATRAQEAASLLAKQEQQRQKELQATITAKEFLTDIAGRASGDNNPFVKLFGQMESSAERAQKSFGIFGEEFASAMSEIEKKALRAEIATARFVSQVQALKYEQEARRLEQPVVGLLGPEERQLDVYNARLRGALRGTAGDAQAEALRKGITSVDPAYLASKQFAELQKLETRLSGLEGRAATAGRDALDEQLKSLFASLDEKTKKEVARNPAFREKFAGAFGRDASRAQREIQDAIQREQTGNLLQQDAREALRLARDSKAPDAAKLKEFLAITGSLSERELTPDLRRARVGALRESAQRESQKEETGAEITKRLLGTKATKTAAAVEGILQKLDRALGTEGKGLKVNGTPSIVNLKLDENLTAAEEMTGPTPKADVTPGRAPGFRY